MRILLIEDDPMIGAGLERALRDQAMSVDWVRDGEDGEAALETGEYALVLLDLGLPNLPGMEVLRHARQHGNATPLLIITARDDVESREPTLWRYRELLPIDGDVTVGAQVGFTPLVKADRLAKRLGVREIWVKNDTVIYPSLSFKDRVVSVADRVSG